MGRPGSAQAGALDGGAPGEGEGADGWGRRGV